MCNILNGSAYNKHASSFKQSLMMEYNKNSQKHIRELSGMFPFPSRCNIWTLIEVLCCVVKQGGSLRMNEKGVSRKLDE